MMCSCNHSSSGALASNQGPLNPGLYNKGGRPSGNFFSSEFKSYSSDSNPVSATAAADSYSITFDQFFELMSEKIKESRPNQNIIFENSKISDIVKMNFRGIERLLLLLASLRRKLASLIIRISLD